MRPSTASTTTGSTRATSENIIDAFLEGKWPERIAADFGITQARVEAALAAEGYTPHRFKYPEEEIQGWIQRYTGEFDGTKWSIAEISRKMYSRRKVKPAYGTIAMRLMERLGQLRHPIQAQRLAHAKRRDGRGSVH